MAVYEPPRSYHHDHPKIGPALDITGEMFFALAQAKIPNTVIAEAMLQEIAWMIGSIDANSPEAAAMRGVISWFSDQCSSLVTPPSTAGRLDRH